MAHYEHQRPRTVNPVLAMQGITKFARSIPSLPADALRELERADDVLRGTSAAGAKVRLQSRAAAFGEAEARVRSALDKIEACCCLAADVMENQDTLAMSTWLRSMVARTMSGNTVPRAVIDKPQLDRLCSLLTVLLSKWPRGERWFTKADRASAALVRVASTEDAPGLVNDPCVPFIGSCASAVFDGGAMCALLGASLGGGTARDDMTTKKRKRWGDNDLCGSSSGETEQHTTRNCATPPPPLPSLGVATASSPPTICGGDSSEKEIDGRPFSRVRSVPEAEPPPLPPPPVLLDALNISSTTSTTTRDTETEDAETDAALASARSELEAANAVIMAGDASRASRVYRSAIARFELVRCSTSDRQRRRYGHKVLAYLRRASTRARAAAHVIENATVEHVDPCAWGDPPLEEWQKMRDSDVLHRAGLLIAKKDDAETPLLDLFTDDDDDDDDDMERTSDVAAMRPRESNSLASSHQKDDWCVHCFDTKLPDASDMVRQRRSRLLIDTPLQTRSLSIPEALEQVYELGETLGKGSYGVVRVATRRTDGAKFACKTILLDAKLSDAALDRLHSEIAAMRKLDHPNICRLHDVFYAKRAAHLVMDLCTGGELWQYVLRQGRARSDHHSHAVLDEAAAACFARQMLSAVRYMHEAGVCHRDLKPQNWLFATSERDAPLKLIDFGLARHFCERPVPILKGVRAGMKVRRPRADDVSTDTESVESFFSDLSPVATGEQRPCASCCTTTMAGVGGLFENGQRQVVFGRPDAPDSQRRASFDENAVLPTVTKEPIEKLPIEDDQSDESDEIRAPSALEDSGASDPVTAASRLFAAGYTGSAATAISLSACPEMLQQSLCSGGDADPQRLAQYLIPADEEPVWTAAAAAAAANWPEMGVFAAAAAAPASPAPHSAPNHEWENFLALRREAIRAAAERARRSKRGYLSDRVGSFYFVAPEVLRGSHDARCDLWSLGVIVYMLLSGAPPFGGRTDKEILARVSKAKLAFPDKLFCDTSPQACLFVARLLDRDVDRRMTASRALHEEWITTHATPPYDRERRSARIARSARQFAQLDALSKLAVVVVAARLPHNEIGDVAADFAAFDQDGDGRLSLSEFFAALGGRVSGDKCASSELGVDVEEAAALFDALDVKGDGRAISYREFVAANLCGRLTVNEHRLRDAFEAIDIEATGYLTPRAVRNFVGVDRCVGLDDHDPSAVLESHIAESADKVGLDFRKFSRLFFAQYPDLDLDGDIVIPDCAAAQRMSSSSSL